MSRFQITFNGVVIGHTDFEFGDPPMGVAFGRFDPTANYTHFQSAFSSEPRIASLELRAITPDGVQIECAGLAVEDFSAEFGELEIQITALGISKPPYSKLFPQHVEQYDKQFPSAP